MRSFGVEEELLLVDESSGRPVAVASLLLDGGDAAIERARADSVELTAELQQEMLEVVTSPEESLAALRVAIAQGRASADRAARLADARVVALATSPIATQAHLMPHGRYVEMARRYGAVARGTLVCGCHVHVSIDSPDEGVVVLDRIRTWLPVLAAVSSNSPFHDGEDTGYASYRSVLWRQWPSSGPLEVLGSREAYEAFAEELRRTEVLIDDGMIYFDARLSRNHPTIELRVADICLRQTDAAFIAAVARGLVETAAREAAARVEPSSTSAAALRLAAWRASLDGLSGTLIDPVHGTPVPAADALARLVDHIRPALDDAGDTAFVEASVENLIERGTGADWQRARSDRAGSLEAMVADAIAVTYES